MNIERLKQRLLNREKELLADTARLEGEARLSGETEVRDSTDAATASEGASESLQEETFETVTLKQVQDALQHIKEGTYGKCGVCGRPIEAARLEAVPWAAYCLEDQEKRDRAAHVAHGGVTL